MSCNLAKLVFPIDLMKFRLTYEGPLPTSGSNTSGRVRDKWAIRKAIEPQLAELWATHPILKGVGLSFEGHGIVLGNVFSDVSGDVTIEPSASVKQKRAQPIIIAGQPFIPLVRKSLELACGLDILFLRKEQPGSLVLQGGDIDNRLKTLFDALKIPSAADLAAEKPDNNEPFFCLLEQDALITNFSVETDRLLTKPDSPVNQVYLVIDVTVKVMTITTANVGFLGN